MVDNSVSFLGHGWIVLKVIESREGTSFFLCRHNDVAISIIYFLYTTYGFVNGTSNVRQTPYQMIRPPGH